MVLFIVKALILSGTGFLRASPSFKFPIVQDDALSFLVKFVLRSRTKALPSSEKQIEEGLTTMGFCATISTLNPSRVAMPLSAELAWP